MEIFKRMVGNGAKEDVIAASEACVDDDEHQLNVFTGMTSHACFEECFTIEFGNDDIPHLLPSSTGSFESGS